MKKVKKIMRKKHFSVLLNILDQIETRKNIIFIATTNNVKELPPQIKDRFSGSMFNIPHFDFNRRKNLIQKPLDDNSLGDNRNGFDDETGDRSNFEKEASPTEQCDQKMVFAANLNDGDATVITKKSSNFSCRDINEMRDGAKILALRKYVDEGFNITQLHIPVTREHFIEAIREIQAIKRETAPSYWKQYKETFRDFYPLFLSTVQVVAGLGLQFYGMKQQSNFARSCHVDQLELMETFQASQMEFYERTHGQQVIFQNKVHIEQMAQQKSLQEESNKQQLQLQKTAQADQLQQSKNAGDDQLALQRSTAKWQWYTQLGFGALDVIAKTIPYILRAGNG